MGPEPLQSPSMIRISQIALGFLVSLFSSVSLAEQPGESELSSILANVGASSGTPLIDLSVTSPGGLCFAGLFDRRTGSVRYPEESGEPPRFHAASISKLFTAVAVMQLRDEGKLGLDDLIGSHLPEYSSSEIRIRHLLTHTSGLRDKQKAAGRDSDEEVNEYFARLARRNHSRTPSGEWKYSDAGFNLLGRLVEVVTGRSFSEELRFRILLPLDMNDSDFEIERVPSEQSLVAFSSRGKELKHPWDRAFLPSSGLQTTARDLSKFGRAILEIAAGDEDGLIRPETLKQMVTQRVATEWNGVGQGYGWQLINGSSAAIWRHAGGESGFESLFALYPKTETGIAALGNREDWPRFELVQEIYQAVAGTTSCTP